MTLRIGILGAAKIARLFVEQVRPSRKVTMRAVASRDARRARAFADELGIGVVHASYEALLADPEIDAVYNPLPNNLHAEWSIRAVEAGKHVLCEKPLAMSGNEARTMFEAARRKGVHLVEGYPYRAQPQTLKLRELLAAGTIGRLQTVQAGFGIKLDDPANIRWDRALGGGALMDTGSYPVSLVRMIAGERPTRVYATARWSESDVDRTLAGTLEFASGLLAQISTSMATARHRRCLIAGDAGTLSTTYFNDTGPEKPPLVDVVVGTNWGAKHETIETASIDGFLAEADAFADLVAQGMAYWTGATPEESIDIAFTLEALAASARKGIPVEVPR
jgi:predicted dehydrogenase